MKISGKNLNFCLKYPLKNILCFPLIKIQRVAFDCVNPVECHTFFVFGG